MTIVCPNCSTRLQLDDAKAPSGPFTVHCPKCQAKIEAQSANSAVDHSGLGSGKSPATEQTRFERPVPAPPYRLGSRESFPELVDADTALENIDDAARLLVELMHRSGISADQKSRRRRDRRRLLLCVSPMYRETIARLLTDNGYEVFVAENSNQALESMREERMGIVILDPLFDPVEQGSAFVTREVNTLRPADRRRLFFVSLSPAVRTFDLHAAFLTNYNLVVNPSDIEKLPRVLDRAIRDFNELYRDFNTVARVSAF